MSDTIRAIPEPIGFDSMGVPRYSYQIGDRISSEDLAALEQVRDALETYTEQG